MSEDDYPLNSYARTHLRGLYISTIDVWHDRETIEIVAIIDRLMGWDGSPQFETMVFPHDSMIQVFRECHSSLSEALSFHEEIVCQLEAGQGPHFERLRDHAIDHPTESSWRREVAV